MYATAPAGCAFESIPICDLSVTVDLNVGMLRLTLIIVTMARGKLTTAIAIGWHRRPAVTRYDIRLGATPMAQLLGGFCIAKAGTTGTIKGRIQLTGTGDGLHDSFGSSSRLWPCWHLPTWAMQNRPPAARFCKARS